ncbi:hypothetical protein A2U01_0042756, partial [Trifolium medium]|nr:hypothetical protein [Trifolium medium]
MGKGVGMGFAKEWGGADGYLGRIWLHKTEKFRVIK